MYCKSAYKPLVLIYIRGMSFKGEEKYLNDPQVRGLIDLMDTVIIPDEEFESMGAEAGCGILEIFFKDGTAEKQILLKPEGIMSGTKCPEIGEKMKKLVADKQKMIEDSFGYDLAGYSPWRTVFILYRNPIFHFRQMAQCKTYLIINIGKNI